MKNRLSKIMFRVLSAVFELLAEFLFTLIAVGVLAGGVWLLRNHPAGVLVSAVTIIAVMIMLWVIYSWKRSRAVTAAGKNAQVGRLRRAGSSRLGRVGVWILSEEGCAVWRPLWFGSPVTVTGIELVSSERDFVGEGKDCYTGTTSKGPVELVVKVSPGSTRSTGR